MTRKEASVNQAVELVRVLAAIVALLPPSCGVAASIAELYGTLHDVLGEISAQFTA